MQRVRARLTTLQPENDDVLRRMHSLKRLTNTLAAPVMDWVTHLQIERVHSGSISWSSEDRRSRALESSFSATSTMGAVREEVIRLTKKVSESSQQMLPRAALPHMDTLCCLQLVLVKVQSILDETQSIQLEFLEYDAALLAKTSSADTEFE